MFSGQDDGAGPSNRVRVEDALSYLDQVKTMFIDQPAIYTHFLDIMKDFKSQAIDTPGVIGRVTQLFRGHRALIVGFNTFLPAGFEVRIDEEDRITIREPNGNVRIVENVPLQLNEYPVDEDDYEDEEDMEDEMMDDEEEDEDEEEEEGEGEENVDEETEGEGTPLVTPLLPPLSTIPSLPSAGLMEVEEKREEETAVKDVEKSAVENYISVDDSEIEWMAEIEGRVEEEMQMVLDEERNEKDEKDDGEGSNAISYVNTIKHRFANSPVVYKEFLKILTIYQKRHSYVNQYGGSMARTERIVMGAIGDLFGDHPDLVSQFRFFLPSTTSIHEDEARLHHRKSRLGVGEKEKREEEERKKERRRVGKGVVITRRKMDIRKAINKMSREDIILFERIRQVTSDYEFRIIMKHCDLYSSGIASKKDFITGVAPILTKFPNVYNNLLSYLYNATHLDTKIDQNRAALEIDYSAGKLNGISYRSLPDSAPRPKCSGRTPLCWEVLNETWISIPSWASEDSSVVSAKKTQFEEFIYRTEDERFELDIVIETNKYAIGCLMEMQYRLGRMSNAEINKWAAKDDFGVSSPSIFLRAVRRVYGELAGKMLECLKKESKVTVDTMLDTLREKDNEWREAQKIFNKGWKEQAEKYHNRSLDHHTTQVKNADSKQIRAKNLINLIENLHHEATSRPNPQPGPQISLRYDEDRRSIVDATDLIIHHVRRSNLSKEEKKRVKNVLRKFVPEMLSVAEGVSSDNEEGGEGKKNGDETDCEKRKMNVKGGLGEGISDKEMRSEKCPPNSQTYRLIYAGNTFYFFIMIHHILCQRLAKLRRACERLWEEQKQNEHMKEHSASWKDIQKGLHKLGGKPSHAPSFDHVMFLVKESLDGNIEPVHLEDEMRSMIPAQATMAFSIDKIVMAITRQLQVFSSPDTDKAHTLSLYTKYRMEKAPSLWGNTQTRKETEEKYLEEAIKVMEGHNCYRVMAFDREQPIVTIELIGKEKEEKKKGPGGRPKKDKKKRGRWAKKDKMKRGRKAAVPAKVTIPLVLPHGKTIDINPFNNSYLDDKAKEPEAAKDEPMTEDEKEASTSDQTRTMFFCRTGKKKNVNKLRKRVGPDSKLATWFL